MRIDGFLLLLFFLRRPKLRLKVRPLAKSDLRCPFFIPIRANVLVTCSELCLERTSGESKLHQFPYLMDLNNY